MVFIASQQHHDSIFFFFFFFFFLLLLEMPQETQGIVFLHVCAWFSAGCYECTLSMPHDLEFTKSVHKVMAANSLLFLIRRT
jgi:hypothetical protein